MSLTINDFLSGAGNTLADVGSGAAAGFLTGGPLGAILGGAYGAGYGINSEVQGRPNTLRGVYQSALPAAVLGLGAFATLPSAADQAAFTSQTGAAPSLSQILSAQVSTASSAISGSGGSAGSALTKLPGAIGGGLEKALVGTTSGLAKFAGGGALIGALESAFRRGPAQAASVAGPHLPTILGGAAQPAGAPVVIAAPAAQQAGISPLLLIAALGVGVYFLFGKHHGGHK